MPDSSADIEMCQSRPDSQFDLAQWSSGFQARVDKHSRSFSQPNLHMQNEMMFTNSIRGKKNKHNKTIPRLCDFDPTQSKMYYQGQWPAWEDLDDGFSQSMGNLGEQRPHSTPTYQQLEQGHSHIYENNYEDWNGSSNSFYTRGQWENNNVVDREGMSTRHQRRGSFDSRIQPRGRHYEKPKVKNKGKYRDRSYDQTFNTLQRRDETDKYLERGYNVSQSSSTSGYRDSRDGEFLRPERRDTILERGRGTYREGRSRGQHYDNSKPDKYSPESTSSTDSGGLKRRLDDESHHKPGKSRRDNDSNRVAPDDRSAGSMRHNKSKQMSRSRSRSCDQLHDQHTQAVDEEGMSRSMRHHVTWSDQQPESEQPTRTRSLERLSEPITFVKPDSTSGGKKGKKKGKQKNSRRNFSPEDDMVSRRKGGKYLLINNGKEMEKSSTDTVLEKAEKLCKKLRNEREKAKQQRILAEKQKKMSKTEQINFQIEELSKRNKENIKGHLESAESVLLTRTVGEERPNSKETGSVELEPVHDKPTRPASTVKPQPPKEQAQKQASNPKANTEINNRIAQTRADIDAIRAKIENSVQSEMCNSSSSETSKLSVKPATETSKSSRVLAQTEMLSPGAAYSPSNSVKKMDQNALLNMVKSPRSTKERLWLAEMLRTHAKSQTKLSFPRFNLKFSDLCTGSDRPNDLTDFDICNLAPSVQLEIANIIEADTKPDVTELEKLLDQASEGNAELDSNILSELGIFQSPEKPLSKPRSPSPMQSGSPIVMASQRYVDHRPSLSIEDLSTVTAQKPQSQEDIHQIFKPTIPKETPVSLPQSAKINTQRTNTSNAHIAPDFSSTPNTTETFGSIRIKEEKIDDGYEAAVVGGSLPASSYAAVSSNTGESRVYRNAAKKPSNPDIQTRAGSPHSPVRKTILSQAGSQPQTGYAQTMYSNTTDMPERDGYMSTSRSHEVIYHHHCATNVLH